MALKDAQRHLDSRSQTYLTFSITDPVEGSLTFYWGDAAYSATNAYGGPPVSACVVSWGNLVKYLPEGAARQNQAVLRLAMDAYATATNTNSKRYTIRHILQNMDLRDVSVSIYQWNQGDTSQEVIWKGYYQGISGHYFDDGVAMVDVIITSLDKAANNPIGSLVTQAARANAPRASIGLSEPKGYGSLTATVDSANDSTSWKLSPVALGYGTQATLAIAVDEALAYSGYPSTRYIGCENDGIAAAKASNSGSLYDDTSPSSSAAVSSWAIYDQRMDAFGIIDTSSPNVQGQGNNTSETYADIVNSPKAWFILRPSERASSTSAGLTDVQPVMDDDAANYITLDATNTTLGLICPALTLPNGAFVQEIRIALDFYTTTGIMDVGLYNAQTGGYWTKAAGASYQTLKAASSNMENSKRCHIITGAVGGTNGGAVYNAGHAVNNSTMSSFSSGQFVYLDGSNALQPLHIRLARSSGDWNIYTVALAVRISYPTENSIKWVPVYELKEGVGVQGGKRGVEQREFRGEIVGYTTTGYGGPPRRTPGVQMTWAGQFQQDDGSGTITGTASALIEKAPDIARHLVQVVAGKTVNSTSGTLGNFVDARTEETAGDRVLSATFGVDVVGREDALQRLMNAAPWLKVYQEDGVFQCVIDHTNPHSSQVYRSTSDPVEIEPWDIIGGQINIEEPDSRTFINNVTVNCGHSFGSNRPMASFTYDNPLSQGYWGASQELQVEAPWCHVSDLASGAPQSADFLAKYYGRINARPRLTVTLGLAQKFYDLRPGHALQFSRNMETAGIHCPAYRTGRLDQLHPADAVSANFADDTTPTLMSGASVDREMYAGASYQFPSLTINVSSAASYTASANPWQYYDGSAWQDLTNVSCSDGRAANQALASTGTFTVTWDRPTITSWKKAELTFSSVSKGPVYWVRHKGVTVTAAASGGALVTIPATWWGRLFIVRETNRRAGAGGYPYMEAVLEEVM